jgi:C4-dicarboxylate-specific signal transduction histidine kinase
LQLWHTDRVAQTGAITASLAHELNQPLTAILSNAQAGLRFLDGGNADLGEIRAILVDIVHDDKRAGTIISGLRTMLRRKETPRERTNLAHTIEEVLALVHSELVSRHVDLRQRLEPGAWVLADKGQVQQVMLNLLMNAAEAMQDQPADQRPLELTLTRTDTGEALVAVRDSGPGIPEDQQDKLFEAFWTTKPMGLGIGLPISRSIIESHGGRLFFTNNPDQGATFSFTLPLVMHVGPSRPGASSASGPGAA